MKVVGIDLGTHKVSLALVRDGELLETMTWDYAAGHRADVLCDLANQAEMQIHRWQPDHIFMEDVVVGNNRKYSIQIAQVMGAVLAAVGHGQALPIAVNNREWKKITGQKMPRDSAGQKEVVRAWLRERSEHAYSVVCDRDQVRIDAACIALYGYDICHRASGLNLTFD